MRMREYELRSPFVGEPEASTPSSISKTRQILTVSELTRQIQNLLEEAFSFVWVQGEISQPTLSTKGHLYFSLKDSQALVRCVVWRDARQALRFNVEHGLQAICAGRLSVYPQRGDYQLYVEHLEPKGIGALQLAFEQLKEKLQKEGLFNEERKRPLPLFPERIGVVTSPTGAAIQDILKILHGHVAVSLRPVRVQGDGSAHAVAQAIKELNAFDGLDLLIVGRGGGSLEDLWAFNDEEVARAIAASHLPVISAVGHEKDVTISDLVADVRAPTPTKGAELVLTQRRLFLERFAAVLEREVFTEPEEWLQDLREKLEELETGLVETLQEPLLMATQNLRVLHGELLACSPQAFILHQAQKLHGLTQALTTGVIHTLEQLTAQVHGLAGRLHALSPLAVLERGYSITFDHQGRILKSAAGLKVGDAVETQLHRGSFKSRIESIGGD